MAIMHAQLSYISRSGSGSVASHAAYISANMIGDERIGVIWDYTKKGQEILSSNILAPEGALEWVYDAEKLWNAVENFEDYIAEKRFKGHKDTLKNEKSLRAKEEFLTTCMTGYKLIFALPLEITDKKHLKELAERVVKECYVAYGLVAQYAIHDMKGNPHLHVLTTTRPFVDGAFAEKRHTIDKVRIKEIRKQLADISNAFAQEKGYDYHLDHRSYKDQGLKIVATRHIGPQAFHKLKERSYKLQENEEIRQKNIEILLKYPEELIKIVASQKAVFTQVDLAKEIFKRVGGDATLYTLLQHKVAGIELPDTAIIGKTLNDNLIYESKSIKFNEHHYSSIIDRFTAHVLSQGSAIYLGRSVLGEGYYTSQEMKELEEAIINKVDVLKVRVGSSVHERDKLRAISSTETFCNITFSAEQKAAIDHLLAPYAISILTGKAGTGKTTVLKPVVEAYRASGLKVLGVAFQGKVGDHLAHDLGIESYTLDQLKVKWDRQEQLARLILNQELKGKALIEAKAEVERLQGWRLSHDHVVILDEGSMVSASLWKSLLKEIERSGAKLRIVQDNKQIKALYGLDAARLVEEKVGSYELKGVVRQREQWMREASIHLNEHRIEEGLTPYYDQGHFDLRETAFGAKASLVTDYLNGIEKDPLKSHMVLAQKNKDVIELNELIRGKLLGQGKLGQEFIFGKEGEGILSASYDNTDTQKLYSKKSAYGKHFAIGERVMFLSNDHKEKYVQTLNQGSSHTKGIKNGTLGIIESFDLKRQTVAVKLHDGRLVGFDTRAYDALTHAYAITINKAQGATFDQVYGFFSSFNANQLLIWLTRHKENFKGYISKELAPDLKGMIRHIRGADNKGLTTDYDVPETLKPYFNLVQQYWRASKEAGNLLTQIEALTEQSEKAGKKAEIGELWKNYKALCNDRNQGAKDILKNWVQCSSFIQQTGVKRETLEVQAGLRKRLLSVAEQVALDKVEAYHHIADQARKLWREISKSHPGVLSYSHPDYESYATLKGERDELAYEMASFPSLYKPYFKVKAQRGAFITYGGAYYHAHPHSFKAVLLQAEQYIEQKRSEAYEKRLSFEERKAYTQVREYQSLYHQSVAALGQLKEIEKIAVTLSVIETHQAKIHDLTRKRDELAYSIVSNYDGMQPFVEKLSLKEDQLLKHAVYGEVRYTIDAYTKANSIGLRTKLADQLASYTINDQGDIDKSIYRLLKENTLSLQRLQFEQGWHKAMQAGKETSIKTIDELGKAYKDLSTFRENKHAQEVWNILKSIDPQNMENHSHIDYDNRIDKNKTSSQEIERTKAKAINFYDREEVLACLTRSHIEGIFARHIDEWVTTPKMTYHRDEIRYGSKGGFVINRDTGVWYNFSAGVGGDIFKYMSHSQNISYHEAIKQLGAEIHAPQLTCINWEERLKRQEALKTQAELEETTKLANAQEKIKHLYEASRPIEGTLAEKYLREHRHIKTAELPQDLRFIREFKDYSSNITYPALAAFARNAQGELRAAQVTCLDPTTGNKANIDVKKRSLGAIKGSMVEIQKGQGAAFIAEGVETALSLKEAGVSGRILVSLGLSNMANVSSHITDKSVPIILCSDADNKTSTAWNASERNFEKLKQEGYKASIIRPQGDNGRDFNDALQEEGIIPIKAALENSSAFKESLQQEQSHAGPIEDQVVSYRLGSTAKEFKTEEIKLNALEIYLEYDNKLNQLPSFASATKEVKEHIKFLRQEVQLYAYKISQDAELKAKAQELGLEKIIKQRAQFHKQDISQSFKHESSVKIKI